MELLASPVDAESTKPIAATTMEEVYTVKVKAQPDAARLYPSERRYSASTVGGLGAVHLALAATCILLAGLDMAQSSPDWTGKYGGGAWLGMAAGLAGLTGILAWRRWYIDNNIRWFFISSCIAGVTAVLCLMLTAAALAATQEEWTTTRLQVLSSLKEQRLNLPNLDPVYSVSLNAGDLEVQRALRNTDISENQQATTVYERIVHPSENRTVSHKSSDTQISGDAADLSGTNQPLPRLPSEKHSQAIPNLEIRNPHHGYEVHENPEAINSEEENIHSDTVSNKKQEDHHVSVRQVVDENQFVDETFEEKHVHNDDDRHVLTSVNVANHVKQPSFNNEQIFQDGNALDPNGNHDSSSIEELKDSDNETDVNNNGQSTDRSVFLKHILTNRGGETRFVIVINLLVASILEIAWSILSAKIAWKGMKNGYPDDGPPRTDTGTLQSTQGDIHIKDKNKSRSKKIGGLRKPDIISNHDGSKEDFSRKPYYREDRKYPSLPKQESPTEYQERVRRFLASNSLASVDGSAD